MYINPKPRACGGAVDVSSRQGPLGEPPDPHLRTHFLVDEALAMETPEAVHICQDCGWELAEAGSELCSGCTAAERLQREFEGWRASRELAAAAAEAYAHAARANGVFAGQPRETGAMPKPPDACPTINGFGLVLLLTVAFWAVLAVVLLASSRNEDARRPISGWQSRSRVEPEHYTKNTVSASYWCAKCGKPTLHRVDSGRAGMSRWIP
ncbi:MAG TPA: hypothetical protein VFW25_12490 [Silvibacterium sp.]|nr:hypothetical protein [Silvibacterium sp.]